MNFYEEFMSTLTEYGMRDFYRNLHYTNCSESEEKTYLDCECHFSEKARECDTSWVEKFLALSDYVGNLEKKSETALAI